MVCDGADFLCHCSCHSCSDSVKVKGHCILVAGLHVADVYLTFFCYAFMLFGVCAGNFFLVNIAIPSQCVPKKAFRYTADGFFHDVSQS